jgi:hypothetical protein
VKAVNRKYEALGQLSVTLDDLKNFRQLESRCPGHPEYRWTSGVETKRQRKEQLQRRDGQGKREPFDRQTP